LQTGLARRIRYKAALCLGTIAASSYGLKSIHLCDGSSDGFHKRALSAVFTTLPPICKMIRPSASENLFHLGAEPLQRAIAFNGPIAVICNNILAKIAEKYRLETVV